VVREVILRGLAGNELGAFVDEEAGKRVSAAVRDGFVADVFEDLEQMDESRLVGWG
jgi:hypothetical protein